MEDCQYKLVNTKDFKDCEGDRKEKSSWKPFFRQVLVCSGIWNAFFTTGLCLGAPTVFIPQLRREANSTEAVSDEMASWISSIHGYAGIPWVLILPVLAERVGRKCPFLICSITSLISYMLFYFSNTVKLILITETLQGPLFAAQITISIIIITEYTSPKYRGMFLTLKSASFNWGMWTSNALGTFYHYKTIAIVGIICSVFNTVSTFFWCESPYWLASKHRFNECSKAHLLLKGDNENSRKELDALISSYKEYQDDDSVEKQNNFIKNIYRSLTQKALYKPLVLCIAILSLYHSSGKLVCSIYAIDIIKKITLTESTAYMGMLLLDGVTVTGMYVGCGLSKILKRRTLLLTGASVGIMFLFVISLYLYLVRLSVIDENKYLSLAFLTMFALSISCGPIIMSTSIYGELVPSRFKTLSMFLIGLYTLIIMATSLKLGPLIFKTFKLHGAFFFYGVMSSIITFLLYKYLPETKDKTLQEIETSLIGQYDHKTISDLKI